jgi:hypothetical protein
MFQKSPRKSEAKEKEMSRNYRYYAPRKEVPVFSGFVDYPSDISGVSRSNKEIISSTVKLSKVLSSCYDNPPGQRNAEFSFSFFKKSKPESPEEFLALVCCYLDCDDPKIIMQPIVFQSQSFNIVTRVKGAVCKNKFFTRGFVPFRIQVESPIEYSSYLSRVTDHIDPSISFSYNLREGRGNAGILVSYVIDQQDPFAFVEEISVKNLWFLTGTEDLTNILGDTVVRLSLLNEIKQSRLAEIFRRFFREHYFDNPDHYQRINFDISAVKMWRSFINTSFKEVSNFDATLLNKASRIKREFSDKNSRVKVTPYLTMNSFGDFSFLGMLFSSGNSRKRLSSLVFLLKSLDLYSEVENSLSEFILLNIKN